MSAKDIAIAIIGAVVLAGLLIFFTTPRQAAPNPNLNLNDLNSNPDSATTSADLNATPSAGLKVEDLLVGTGKEVKSGDTVTMNYTGTLQNGTKFDSSYDSGTPFTTQIGVGQVIKGWDQGIPGMKVGGKRRLTIPSELGYGATGAGDKIPPNSTLIFEVELLDVK